MKAIIYLLPIFLFSFCKKDPVTTIIDGTVINIGSKAPIDGVKVTVVDGISGGDSFFGSSNTSGTGKTVVKYTDAYGKFSISIEGESPFLYLDKEGYRFVVMDYGAGQSVKEYIPGKHYSNEILKLWADAYFKGVFKGKSSIASDSIYFGEGNYIEPLYLLRKDNPWGYGNGSFNDYSGSKGWKGIGDEYFAFWMRYQIKGVWHEKIDSVFIKSFTTYTDTIYY